MRISCSDINNAYDSVSHWTKAGVVISGGVTVLSFMICASATDAEPGQFSRKCYIISPSLGTLALIITAVVTTILSIHTLKRREGYETVKDNI